MAPQDLLRFAYAQHQQLCASVASGQAACLNMCAAAEALAGNTGLGLCS